MNYGALVLVGGGGVAIILAIRGSYKDIWNTMTGNVGTGGTSGDFGSPKGGNENLRLLAQQDATQAGISPDYFLKQIQAESGFNPNAKSPAGAEGIAQFMPGTAASVGLSNPFDPVASLKAAAQYMAGLIRKYGGSEAEALAAYNAGSGTVDNALSQSRATGRPWYQFLPSETQNYIKNIDPGMN